MSPARERRAVDPCCRGCLRRSPLPGRLARAGIGAVCVHRDGYPSSLRALADPPWVLFFTGGRERLRRLTEEPAVAVVGTRRASPYGLEVAYELGRGLGAAGVTVVSGLALGIDAAAHRGALEGGGGALAVLAGGVDVPYPRVNRRLYERIRERGAVLSELPPGRPVYRWCFPARNRIMAGLAAMTVIVEAGEPSGSLITAGFAAELGRDVGAVPGRVTARAARGSNRLLRDGACVVRGPEDVLDELYGVGCRPGWDRAGGAPAREPEPGAALEPALRGVLEAVEAGDGLDAIGARTGMRAGAVRAALGRLEALGLIARDALGSYERTARRTYN